MTGASIVLTEHASRVAPKALAVPERLGDLELLRAGGLGVGSFEG